MAIEADYGFVLWDGKSPGSLNNIIELLNKNKKALVYYSPEKEFYSVSTLDDALRLLDKCDKDSIDLISKKVRLPTPTMHETERMVQGSFSF